MDNAAKETIVAWTPAGTPVIGIAATDHPEQHTFDTFARHWEEISPAIRWESREMPADLPGFFLASNILYSALPLERELAPFLKGVEVVEAGPDLPDSIKASLNRINMPCRLTLYIALQCPHCPVMVETFIPLAAACDNIHLHIIDGSLFPDQAQADKVMAAPCLILDEETRWTGAVADDEVLDMILNRESMGLDTPALKTILEDGRADWITDQMVSKGQLFKGFTGLLLHETWSVRLGAMVVVESLAGQAPDLCTVLEKDLIPAFDTQPVPVQGDILYALGEIGTPDTLKWIKSRLDSLGHEDLNDAAQDAMDAISDRFSLSE